jgi:hypothetical protein
MKKIILSLMLASMLLIIVLSNTTKVDSSGAPIASTGAPGESSCGKSGCHTGNNNLHAESANLSIDIPELTDAYIPGKVYSVTITLNQQDTKRFGFAFSAYNSQKDERAGSLLVSDEKRTQVMAGANQFQNREYVTYKTMGTDPYSENTGKWSFNWKAPEIAAQPLTFYAAAVGADDDGTDNGDQVYTRTIVLNKNKHTTPLKKQTVK